MLVHHDHLNIVEREPPSCQWGLEDELYHFSGVEIAADEFPVRLILY